MTTVEIVSLGVGQHVQLRDGRVCELVSQDGNNKMGEFRFADETIGFIAWSNLVDAVPVDWNVALTPQFADRPNLPSVPSLPL